MVEWKNDIAIYLQVVDLFKKEVILGKYMPNDKILSVREYALKLNVNPNTIVKAYDILAQEGLIEPRSTNGYFITENKEILSKLKPSFATTYCREFLEHMKSIGYSKAEAVLMLKESE